MRRFLQKQTITTTTCSSASVLPLGMVIFILTFSLLSFSARATCDNVHNGGEIGTNQTICSGEGVTISNITAPSGGSGTLEYMWLVNTDGPYFDGATSTFSYDNTWDTGSLTHTTWFRRCARRAGCSSWDYGESNWVKITVANAKFEHISGVDESACGANDGQIITDPYIDKGTKLPYHVEYTYNGQTFTAGPFTKNADNYITGLAPGIYTNITLIDANGCQDVHNSLTIGTFDCNGITIEKECELTDHGIADTHSSATRLVWLKFDYYGIKEYAVDGAASFIQYSDGTALITGKVTQIDDSHNQWYFSVKLKHKRNWAEWSALGRSYKPNNYITGEDHTTWMYYEVDEDNSTFIGLKNFAGQFLDIAHNPGNYEFGFQVGVGANVKDGDFGLSGWFTFSGAYSGHGDFNGDLDCGNSLLGIIFNDKDNDGIQEAGENGLVDFPVTLLDDDGNVVATVNTDSNGFYTFVGLAPGDYKIKVPITETSGPFTFNLTKPNQGTDDNLDSDPVPVNATHAETAVFSVHPGDAITGVDAGYFIGSKITGIAFNDDDADGLQAGAETRIEGITVMLLDKNGVMVDQAVTNNLGVYEFANLAPGDYKIKVDENTTASGVDYILTFANEGTDDDADSDPVRSNSGTAISEVISVSNGQTVDNVDVGYFETAKIGDEAFIDNDANGLNNIGDTPYKGVVVKLSGTDVFGNSVALTEETDADGQYHFSSLVPGMYTLAFEAPDAEFIPTEKDALGNGFDGADSDIDEITGRTDPITVNPGDFNKTIDAGFKFNPSLPVNLTSFEAQLMNGTQVVLKWVTASEQDNKHFIIERSTGGRDYQAIGVVAGNGTTTLVNNYSYEDLDPYYGHNYYRLKQVDFDGKYEYSPVETVIIHGQDLPDLIVYPNPIRKSTTLRVVTPFEKDAMIEVVNNAGRILQVIEMPQGANSKQINMSNYSEGMYYLYINYNGHRTHVSNLIKIEEE
ncbi:MAG: SdrD B-like domain-containing protein [Bacteroidota bacterium]